MSPTTKKWVFAVLLLAILCAAFTPGALVLAAAIASPLWICLYLLILVGIVQEVRTKIVARRSLILTLSSRPPPTLA